MIVMKILKIRYQIIKTEQEVDQEVDQTHTKNIINELI